MKTTTTQHQRVAQEGFLVQTCIQTYCNITAEDHAKFIYEQGLVFLNENYPDELEGYVQIYSSSRVFWKWWKNEWFLQEQDYLRFIEKHKFTQEQAAEDYIDDMSALAHSQATAHSFSQFLRIFKGRI